MIKLAYSILGRYAQLRASTNANVLTDKWVSRSFVIKSDGVQTHAITPTHVQPIPTHLLRQLAIHFANSEVYIEVRFSRIGKRAVLCYGDSALNGLLYGVTPTSITFHAQDEASYGVMMGTALVLYRVAVTVTGI